MKFEFVLSKHLMAYYLLFSEKSTSFSGLRSLKDALWDKYSKSYSFLRRDYPELFYILYNRKSMMNLLEDTNEIFVHLFDSDEFIKIYRETYTYMRQVEREWNINKYVVEKFLKRTLRISIPDENYYVYIVHPDTEVGRYIGELKIVLGTRPLWNNYSTVYIIHEYLHGLFDSLDFDDIAYLHATIELIADNELRYFLHNIADDKGYNFGHSHLKSVRTKLLQEWKKYMLNEKINIEEFILSQQHKKL